MSWLETLVEKFPVRKSAAQKEAFRQWMVFDAAKSLGYEARVEENSGFVKSRNVVVGDPETAEVVFTAHYDTPATIGLPNIMIPRNLPLFYGYQILLVGGLLLIALAAGLLGALAGLSPEGAYWVGWLTYMALLFMLLAGVPNPHNVNDNTSGVAAVLGLMEKLPAEQRGKAAFILFDNEEKGLLGSRAYAKAHQRVQYTGLVVNMDCVGVGETMLVIASKLAAKLPAYARLEEALRSHGGREVKFFGTAGSACSSDQKNFKCGVVVVACRKRPMVGYYCPRIHTPKDTFADQGNLDYLAESFAGFVTGL
ncbi:MAG: M28 family peptidase [Christensenellaceae bacterium]|nr:M28 family peptidase [Christensenellaceae bacterium]